MDVNIKGKFDDLVPDKSMMIWQIEKLLETGDIKSLSIGDQTEMSGLIAEAAAAYLYAEPTQKSKLEIYEILMGIARNLIIDPRKENLTVLKDRWPNEDVWEKVEEEYIKYYLDRNTPDMEKEGDDEDEGFIGEYPHPKTEEEFDEDFIGEYPMPPTK